MTRLAPDDLRWNTVVARDRAADGTFSYKPDVRELRLAFAESFLGHLLVAASARGITAVLPGDDRDALRRDLQRRFPEARLIEGDAGLTALATDVAGIIDSPPRVLGAALDLRGSAFQREVWQALRRIPAGSTATYTDVAGRIGRPGSARAVARACAANHLAVVVPCHRVVRSDGHLSGYRWGIERKRALLNQEARG